MHCLFHAEGSNSEEVKLDFGVTITFPFKSWLKWTIRLYQFFFILFIRNITWLYDNISFLPVYLQFQPIKPTFDNILKCKLTFQYIFFLFIKMYFNSVFLLQITFFKWYLTFIVCLPFNNLIIILWICQVGWYFVLPLVLFGVRTSSGVTPTHSKLFYLLLIRVRRWLD